MEARHRFGRVRQSKSREALPSLVPWPRFLLASLLLWRSIPFSRACCGLDISVRGRFVSLRIDLGLWKEAFANGVHGVGFGEVLHL